MGYCFVDFGNHEIAAKCLDTLNGHLIPGMFSEQSTSSLEILYRACDAFIVAQEELLQHEISLSSKYQS